MTMADISFSHEPCGLRHCVRHLSPSLSAKVMRKAGDFSDVLFLTRGESGLATPDFIQDAATDAMRAGHTGYSPALGIPELRDEIAVYHKRVHGTSLPMNRVFVTASGSAGVYLALASLVNPGDEVIVITPIWGNLVSAIEVLQGSRVDVPLDYDETTGWYLDHDKITAAITPRTVAILVVNPGNPTGWTATPGDIACLLDIGRARNIWIVADEIYHRITYGAPRAHSFLEQAGPEERLFVVNSFSKNWAMTGWRLGWMVGPASAEDVIRNLATYNYFCPALFTQYGGIAALREGEAYLQAEIARWRDNRDFVRGRLAGLPGVSALESAATFFQMIRFGDCPNCVALAEDMVEKARLALAPGCSFSPAAHGTMRLCYAGGRPALEDAMDRLTAYARQKG